jgi:hypothetical protein
MSPKPTEVLAKGEKGIGWVIVEGDDDYCSDSKTNFKGED